MTQIAVKIRGTVISARYGALTSGDILRTDAEYARHLVEDCRAAEYQSAPAEASAEAAPVKPRKAKKEMSRA